MWKTVAPILTGICLFVAIPAMGNVALQAKDEKQIAWLEKKMLGVWKGRGGCDGRLVFRSDGTYELTDYGPAPYDSAGTWKVRWDALPATLFLTCKTSGVPDAVGKTMEVKLIKLDDKSLAFKYASKEIGHYTRVKK